MKIVINRQYGGFGLSREAFLRLRELGCEAAINEPDLGEFWDDGSGPRTTDNSFMGDIDRNDPMLVQVVEELGSAADGWASSLKVIEIPDDVEWKIGEYDGMEWVAEVHRTWE